MGKIRPQNHEFIYARPLHYLRVAVPYGAVLGGVHQNIDD